MATKVVRKYVCAKCGAPMNKSGNGLGTWKCSKGCPKRQFFVKRFIGCGKEGAERNRFEDYPVRRAAAVRVVIQKLENK